MRCEAGFVIGLAEIDGAADLRVHFCAAEFFGGSFLADGGLHQRGTGEEEAGAFGHQDVIAHDREIRAAGDAHAHDGGDLRDAHGAHDRVVAENAAEIVSVGEDVFLQRKKNAGGVDEINCGDAIFDGDILRANYFFRGHGEEGAGFYGGVVGDEHERAAADAGQAGDCACAGRAAPFFVHFPGGVDAKLEELGAGVDEFLYAFAGGEAAFFVLGFDGLCAAADADFLFLIFELGEEVDDVTVVLLGGGGFQVDGGFKDGSGHAGLVV